MRVDEDPVVDCSGLMMMKIRDVSAIRLGIMREWYVSIHLRYA
jgi:hypothetical protein